LGELSAVPYLPQPEVAVVLAAGRGERLRPLTLTRPKPLLEVGGRPLLAYTLSAIEAIGIPRAIVVVSYMEEAIRSWLKQHAPRGLEVECIRQPEPRGTADAIAVAAGGLSSGEEALVVYGDLFVMPEAIRAVVEEHLRHRPLATIAAAPVGTRDLGRFGVIRAEEGWLREVVEKPEAWSGRPLANAGIYILTPEALKAMGAVRPSKRGELEATAALQELARQGDCVRVVEISPEGWLDVGRPWDLLEANERALRHLRPCILGEVEPGANLIGPVFVAEGARVRSGAYIEGPAFIGPGSDIGPNCYIRPCTSLSSNVRIGNACEVKNSIVMEGTHIGHLSYVGDSVIGAYCNLGAGTITANLRFDKANIRMTVKGARVDTGRRKLGAIMGDFVQTGVGALFMPGVRVWPRCWIGANVVVERDITEEGKFIRLVQELAVRDAWAGPGKA